MASQQSASHPATEEHEVTRQRLGAERKRLGAWYTPSSLVDLVVEAVMEQLGSNSATPEPHATNNPPAVMTILDPACGDGRFLLALTSRLTGQGVTVRAIGCDIDAAVLATLDDDETAHFGRMELIHGDALTHDWGDLQADVVIGNPPFLSQMAATTSRGGSSRHGGGPYADAAVEFLALAHRLARDDGGLVALVLPQSILAARDTEPVRQSVDAEAELVWSWWEPRQRHFDASVNVCALIHERTPSRAQPGRLTGVKGHRVAWSSVVTARLGVPALDRPLQTMGTVADRASLNANFRDEYYALVEAVLEDDGEAGHPPLVTSGLIDPGRCWWGEREVRFAKQAWAAPVVDLSRLQGRFPAWASRKLVPKVLVANQTSIIEAVADPQGSWLPGVPVTTVTPTDVTEVWLIAAVLTSPVASAAAWHDVAGTGLSTRSIRIGPDTIGRVPWPAGDLSDAVAALKNGDAARCGRLVQRAFGDEDERLFEWWNATLPSS